MVQPQLVKIGGPWTRSMIRGSMDPVHILMDPVHGPGPQRGSMFCTFPLRVLSPFTGEIFLGSLCEILPKASKKSSSIFLSLFLSFLLPFLPSILFFSLWLTDWWMWRLSTYWQLTDADWVSEHQASIKGQPRALINTWWLMLFVHMIPAQIN